jgi:hypothetical protein
MKKIFVLFLILLLAGTTSSVVLSQFREATAKADLQGVDVYVVTHINDELEPVLVESMLDELEVVTGIQLCIWVDNNDTDGIVDAKYRLEKWMKEFTDYKIVIQCDYSFVDKYGYYQHPFWMYDDTETLSQTWYTNWYGNLSEVINQYPNVVLMVGFNEPYNHFRTKEMAHTIIQREYLTWKTLSNIPFSVEFSMPRLFWADYWGFPENISIEDDLVFFWRHYSDYIGVNLWAYNRPPQHGVSPGTNERTMETIDTLEYYSKELGKPIHINEFPAWSRDIFKYTIERIGGYPNILQVYQLWYWSDAEELHIDGWSYGLYNINPESFKISKVKYSWNVFSDVLMPN